MTKFLVDKLGWVYMIVVLDWYTRKIVGFHIGLRSKSADWLTTLDMAVKEQCPDGVREHDLHLMNDNGSQPTSVAFINACGVLNIDQAFTSYNNPKVTQIPNELFELSKRTASGSTNGVHSMKHNRQSNNGFMITTICIPIQH